MTVSSPSNHTRVPGSDTQTAPPKPLFPPPQTSSANYTFIPYMVTPNNKVYCCESSLMKGLTELMQPSFELLLGPICMPLLDRFTQLLRGSQANSQ